MSDFDNIMAKYEEFAVEQEALKQKIQDFLQEQIKDVFTAFFAEHPSVKTIHWVQYVPYFNDGGECSFTLGDVFFTTTPYDELEAIHGESDEGDIEWNTTTTLGQDMKKISNLINRFDEDVLRAMFDVNVHVKVYPGGFDADDYDCGY